MGDEIKNPGFGGEVNIPEKLLKRDQERQMAIGKRQEEKEGREGDGFGDTFNKHYNQIKTIINQLEEEKGANDNKEKLIEQFADISKQLLLLNHTIIDAKIFLTSYDMKMYNMKLQDLTEHANALEAKLLPRKKFGFKKADKVKPTREDEDKIEATIKNKDAVDFVKKPHHDYETEYIGFHDKNNETLELCAEDVNKKPVSLSNIDSCSIKVNGNASTVHMNNIRNSTIYLGPVSNSVFIDKCSDSTLYLSCHQMRMHTSINTNVYLHVTSRPIIENCKGIGFAPALVHVDEVLFQMSGLDANKNHWQEVDDFNWLSVEEKSPNWFVIEENNRKPI